MSKPTEVILLCEDRLTSVLLRFHLKRLGVDPRNIRFVVAPTGRGAGERFVILQYPQQVEAYRLSKAKKTTWLIVVIDADTGTVLGRIAQLDTSLQECGNERIRYIRMDDELIARLVPRQNVETWILALNGFAANEETDYSYSKSRDDWHDLAISASAQFYSWTRNNAQVPDNCLDSLRQGIRELSRVEAMR